MSYTYSFNTPPPIGFSINASTGLITIAASASPFTGSLSVKVSDGASIVVKSIPVVLAAPIVTPLIIEKHSATCSSGGTIAAMNLDIRPVVCDPGIGPTFAVLEISRNVATCSIGDIRIESLIEDATPVGFVEVRVNFSEYQLAAGRSGTADARVELEYSTSGVNQSVAWAIVSGSNHITINQSGLVSALNGAFDAGGIIATIKATSVAYPTVSGTYDIYCISRFDSVTVTPSESIVGTNQPFTINSILVGAGEIPASATQYINVTIEENGRYSYLSGPSISYTSGADPATINIYASYYYQTGGYVVQGSATVQNTG